MKNTAKATIRALSLFLLTGLLMGPVPIQAERTHAEEVKEALKVMKAEAAKEGTPKSEGISLFFGSTRMNGNYVIVDGLKTRFNCTATLFVKKGSDFIRISTNVLKEGNRALGTVLDQKGPAYAAMAKGEAYYGTVDILGQKYEAGYEPIKNAAGETIGVYYIGFLIE